MLDKLEGKRTYITMAVVIILGAIDSYNQHCITTSTCKAFQVPGFVYSVLGALGIWTRSMENPKKND